MDAELQRLMSPRRQQTRRNAASSLNTRLKNKPARQRVSDGFKALVNQLSRASLTRVVLSRTNLSNAESAYVHAALKRLSQG